LVRVRGRGGKPDVLLCPRLRRTFALGYGARLLVPIFAQPLAWRILDTVIGVVMWVLAVQLVFLG